ncbi:maltase 2-like [Sabethes cyaneus]|uniref:maltase 2-like n=1 Tax=Sabethes cyaneus TaxID=53552 RepID=UPI00237DAFFE|nr:maltase 2-like [Sabethes cyaneus]
MTTEVGKRCSLVFLLALLSVQLGGVACEDLRKLKVSDWWEKSGFYQIYPRSFKDSNGDGIGDLKGITQKLPYLKSIGVKAFWLSPIYKSPMADFGYDISDFRDIQPEYGTLEDFKVLKAEASKLGLKLVMDFVPNHSSDEHEWFVKSENREAGYEDYYVWHDGKPGNNPNRNDPPNNWLEAFKGSAWKWSEKRKQYYLHQFHFKQPDLNYRNSKVVEEMKSVLRFWLDLGVDGFRIDAVNWLFEDLQFRDEPTSGVSTDPLMPDYLNHIYTRDMPETTDMVYQWREVMDEYKKQHGGDTRVIMTESWSSLSVVATYYQDANKRQGSNMPFNFQLILNLNKNSKASDFKRVIESWLNIVPDEQHVANWVLGNHDQRRVASRMGGEHMADLMAMVGLSLPGVSVTYQGEEIGMTDYEVSWQDSKDPAACQTSPTEYQKYSRDPARTPFQWDRTTKAGFTSGSTTWLPINPNYVTVNVETEEKTSNSHLKVFKRLMELRDESIFHDCLYGIFAVEDNIFGIVRTTTPLYEEPVYLTLINIANKAVNVTHENIYKGFTNKFTADMKVSVASVSSKRSEGDSVNLKNLELQPYEGLVLRAAGTVWVLSKLLLLLMIFAMLFLQ